MYIEVDFKALGLLISKYRIEANLSQEKLAERAGVSTNFIGNIERGVKRPSVNTLYSISVALGLTLNDLLNPSVARPVSGDEAHTLRDSSGGYAFTLTDQLLAQREAECGDDDSIPDDSPFCFGILEIDEETFIL